MKTKELNSEDYNQHKQEEAKEGLWSGLEC